MKHLTVEQRYTIAEMKQKGYTQKEIAAVIGKDKSAVSRELGRNCDKRNGSYRSDLAQRKYEKRQKEKPKKIRFMEEMRIHIKTKLEQKYSPEQIVGEVKKEGLDCISVEYIYQFIWKDKRTEGDLYKNLRT